MNTFKRLIVLVIGLVCSLTFVQTAFARTPLIIIDPAGSAGDHGRKLASGYEQGEALRFAQEFATKLKNALNVETEITRAPGQEKTSHQTATLANKRDADLFLHISFYREESVRPKLFLYHLVFNPALDRTSYTDNQLAPTRIDQAHVRNKYQTKVMGNTIKASLSQFEIKKLFDTEILGGIPTKPLVGICSPALTIEMGLNENVSWNIFIAPLVESLRFIAG